MWDDHVSTSTQPWPTGWFSGGGGAPGNSRGCTKTSPMGFTYFLCINIFQLHECQYPTSCFVQRSQNWEVFASFRDLNKSYGYLILAPEARAKIRRVFCIKTAYDIMIFKFQGGAPPAGAHAVSLAWVPIFDVSKWEIAINGRGSIFYECWQFDDNVHKIKMVIKRCWLVYSAF